MTGWLALVAIGGVYVGVLVRRMRSSADDAVRARRALRQVQR